MRPVLPPTHSLVFVIPVVSSRRAVNWAEVEENLARTVNSILRSKDPRVMVVVAHHERPSGNYWQDPRVVSITVADRPQSAGADKRMKRLAIGCWLRNNVETGVYVMFCDADDLVSTALASYVLRDDNRTGYSLANGYLFDVAHQRGQVDSGFFTARCGSSFIGYFSAADLPVHKHDSSCFFGRVNETKHAEHASYMKANGREVTTVPFMAAVYLQNHRNSLQSQVERRPRGVRAGILRTPNISRYILAAYFGAEPVAVGAFDKMGALLLVACATLKIRYRIPVPGLLL